jgi:hypothetical protein
VAPNHLALTRPGRAGQPQDSRLDIVLVPEVAAGLWPQPQRARRDGQVCDAIHQEPYRLRPELVIGLAADGSRACNRKVEVRPFLGVDPQPLLDE